MVDGHHLALEGVELPPLWRWFDRSQPLPKERVARVFCHCGSGPVALINRVWQDGREGVALIEYQQRKFVETGKSMTLFTAVLHPADEHCRHGKLVMHPDDDVEVHCPSHIGTLTGNDIVRQIHEAGGWTASLNLEPPKPRRLILR